MQQPETIAARPMADGTALSARHEREPAASVMRQARHAGHARKDRAGSKQPRGVVEDALFALARAAAIAREVGSAKADSVEQHSAGIQVIGTDVLRCEEATA